MQPTTNALINRDYVLIIDMSGSMNDCDMGPDKTQSRWQAAAESTYAIAAKLLELTQGISGIDIYLFSNEFKKFPDVKDPQIVENMFKDYQPSGGTNLTEVLSDALNKYLSDKKEGKYAAKTGKTIVVITDGIPNDEATVKKTIIDTTHKLDNGEELALSFIQIGHNAAAGEFLVKLDDDLIEKDKKIAKVDKKHHHHHHHQHHDKSKSKEHGTHKYAKFDIVDTIKIEEVEEVGLTQVLLDAILN